MGVRVVGVRVPVVWAPRVPGVPSVQSNARVASPLEQVQGARWRHHYTSGAWRALAFALAALLPPIWRIWPIWRIEQDACSLELILGGMENAVSRACPYLPNRDGFSGSVRATGAGGPRGSRG